MLRFARLTAALTIAGIVAIGAVPTPRVGATAPAAALVKTAPMHILVNSKGMTLYLFSPDKPNKSVCTGIGGPFGAAIRADGSR